MDEPLRERPRSEDLRERTLCRRIAVASVLLSLVIFGLDLMIPMGVAAGVPYIAVVLLSLWLPVRRHRFALAILGTTLTIAGFFLQFPQGVHTPDAATYWIGLENRAIAVSAIWTTAALGDLVVRRNTQLRERELAVRRERDFAESLIETANSIVLVLDSGGRIVRFNRFTEELTGRTLREAKGEDWFEQFVPVGQRTRVRRQFQDACSGQQLRESVSPILVGEGLERHIAWSCKPLLSPTGAVLGLLAVGQDLTELLQTQQRALQGERLAAIGQTITVLSHESCNELNAMKLGLELLGAEVDQPQTTELIEPLRDNLRRLDRLFDDVRSYAAPIQLERRLCHVADVWRQAWFQITPLHQHRDVNLVEHHPTIDLCCWIDSFRLEQVFRNLFENSLAACSDPVYIEIDCEENADRLRIRYRDNGPGMTPEVRQRLFEPFFTTKSKGSGLGMAICKRIVESHGGRLIVGRVDRGAEFLIELPRGSEPAHTSQTDTALLHG